MERESIGELEELVLLTVGSLYDKAYAVNIVDEIRDNTQRILDVTAVHSVLRRLEKKGFVNSVMGQATAERGGRRKRMFTLTLAGRAVLDNIMAVRLELYQKLPKLSFSGM
ncbi:MAG: helix-turn-helix transcriptional regulator [Cyclobacteriaceae bacterium]